VRRVRGAAVPLLAAALVLAPGAAVAQVDRPEIASVSFEGNEVFPDDSLRAAIISRATACRSLWFQITLLCPLGWDAVIDRQYLRPRELRNDVARLEVYYLERGFREVAVDTTVVRDDGRVEIAFRIEEGTPVRVDSLELLLLEPLPDSSAFEDLPLRKGDPLSTLLMDAARDSIQTRLQNRGYAYADVLLSYFLPTGSREARVTLDVDPGPHARFGAIRVEGNRILESESLRRMLPFRAGSPYSLTQVLEGQRNLYTLDIVQSATVRALRDSTARDSVIPVSVDVNESTLHRVRTALGWTTADCLTAEVRWASRNFRGGARRLEARARISNVLAPQLHETACRDAGTGKFAELNGQLSLELVQPWLVSPRNSLAARAYVERQSLAPDIFIREAVGFNLTLRRSIGRRSVLSLSYEPQVSRFLEETGDVFLCATFLACLPSDIEAFRGLNWLAPVVLGASRDRRDNILNPTRGYHALLGLEHAAGYTGSDFAYSRVLGEAAGYTEVGTTIMAARLRAGVVGAGRFDQLARTGRTDLVHPLKRFFAGGANSVRGFPENRLGPRVLTADVADLLSVSDVDGAVEPVCAPEEILPLGCDPSAAPDADFTPRPVGGGAVVEGSVELRVPVGSAFQGVAFFDYGNVWTEAKEVRFADLEVSPGLGFRYFSPIGPVRVDVAYRFREGESLLVATEGIRAFDPERDDEADRIEVRTASGVEPIAWVIDRDQPLVFLLRRDPFGDDPDFWSRLQLHISIGQAF
jgi:outer membrane protein insertion porin family/translocation and assembly module TamA